jgi:flagellar basal-body rod modification protein FlgD
MQAAALVGKGVMVEGKALTLSGSKAYGGFELTSAADKVTVTIKDSGGNEIRKMELGAFDAGVFNFAWDGKTTNGTQAVDGKYTMSVTATRGSDDVKPIALQLTTVNSVLRTSKGEVSLDVGSGNLVSLTDIKQIL